MLFRATRGNMLFNQAPADVQIMDPISTEMVFSLPLTLFFGFKIKAYRATTFYFPIHFVVVSCQERMRLVEILVSLRFVY